MIISTPKSCDTAMEVAVWEEVKHSSGGSSRCDSTLPAGRMGGQKGLLLSPPQGRFLKNRNQIYSRIYSKGRLG